jgi:hypothetical protein
MGLIDVVVDGVIDGVIGGVIGDCWVGEEEEEKERGYIISIEISGFSWPRSAIQEGIAFNFTRSAKIEILSKICIRETEREKEIREEEERSVKVKDTEMVQ